MMSTGERVVEHDVSHNYQRAKTKPRRPEVTKWSSTSLQALERTLDKLELKY